MQQQKAWEIIANRVTKEQDPEMLTELTHELIDALDEEMRRGERTVAKEQHGAVDRMLKEKD